MKFIVDNNLGWRLALALAGMGADADHITEHFDRETADEVWLPWVGERGYVLFTRDQNIRLEPMEQRALLEYRVRGFLVGGKKLPPWKILGTIANNFETICTVADHCPPPFLFRVPTVPDKWPNVLEQYTPSIVYPPEVEPFVLSLAEQRRRYEANAESRARKKMRRAARDAAETASNLPPEQ